MLLKHLTESFRRPDHWLYAGWLDIVTTYRRTYFGVLWLLIPTAVYVWGIGGFLAALQPGVDTPAFLAHVGVGFVVYRLASTVWTDATSVFSGHRAYIYDGHLRLTDFLLRSMSRSVYYFLLTQAILVFVVFASPEFTWAGVPLSLAGLALVLVNLFAYSVVLGLAGARFPDLGELVSSAMLAGFLLTPVVWDPELAPEGTVRGLLMRANPLHHLLAVIRDPLLGRPVEQVTYVYMAVMTVLGIVMALVAYRRYCRRVAIWL